MHGMHSMITEMTSRCWCMWWWIVLVGIGGVAVEADVPSKHGPFHDVDPVRMTPLRFEPDPWRRCEESTGNDPSNRRWCRGDVDLSTYVFAGLCENITGNVVVTNAIRYPPFCLKRIIQGDLIVEENELVSSMYGFGSLEEIYQGNLRIQGNPRLNSLRGLDSLRVVHGSVYISFNGEPQTLSSLDGLVFHQLDTGDPVSDAVTRVYRTIEPGEPQDDPVWPIDDSEFHFARRARRARVEHGYRVENPLDSTLFEEDKLVGMIDLRGLGSLETVQGDLYVVGNGEMQNFVGLEQLRTVQGSLYVERNTKLENGKGLDMLETIQGNAHFVRNDKLDSLQGMSSLGVIAGNLEIIENNAMSSLGKLPNLTHIGGDLSLRRNRNLTFLGDDLALQTIQGSFLLDDNRHLVSTNGLEQLREIGGDLVIFRNPKLVSLNSGGLSGLSNVNGSVYIQGSMENYTGLEGLRTINGSLYIHSLQHLTSLHGLENLEMVRGDVLVYLNPRLHSISQLSSLRVVLGGLRIHSNENLSDVDGVLDELEYVGGYLQIQYQRAQIDCPHGTGMSNGQTSMMGPDQTVPGQNFGNWCAMNCVFPLVTSSPSDSRMWSSRPRDVWSPTWGPRCV